MTRVPKELVALGKRLADPAKNMLVALGRAVGEGLLQILTALFVAVPEQSIQPATSCSLTFHRYRASASLRPQGAVRPRAPRIQ